MVVARQRNNKKARQQWEFQVRPLVPKASRETTKEDKQQGRKVGRMATMVEQ
jgi:hypothetical protein